MDAFQARLARIALEAVGDRGFVLGGGHAVQIHGMAARLSEDIDLFSTDRGRPAEVEADVVAAFRRHQLTVTVTRHTADLDRAMFAESLGFLARIPDREFEAYGVGKEHIVAMRAHFAEWQQELRR